jgi:selenocysteine lyase/cysteine desulfurase
MISPMMPLTGPLTIAEAAQQFSPDRVYLNTATLGLPPVSVVRAMHEVVDRWASGELSPQDFDGCVTSARASFARIMKVAVDCVAVGHTVSGLVGCVAASLPFGSEVLCAEGDFTSLLFPFLTRQKAGELSVRLVAPEALIDAIGPSTTLVAVSAVQSSDGRVFEAAALESACRHFGARSLIDATQAAGWLPISAGKYDFVVATAYKWLLSPRGSAFMCVRPERLAELRPLAAGWYAGEDIWSSIYGSPLRLAHTARRLDESPAWFSWLGCATALELIERLPMEEVRAHGVRLASSFLERVLGREANSAIVTVPGDGVADALAAANIAASRRAGGTRLSFHFYNTEEHALAAADVVLQALRR